eukprot:1937596-Rhodomonas_salina.1
MQRDFRSLDAKLIEGPSQARIYSESEGRLGLGGGWSLRPQLRVLRRGSVTRSEVGGGGWRVEGPACPGSESSLTEHWQTPGWSKVHGAGLGSRVSGLGLRVSGWVVGCSRGAGCSPRGLVSRVADCLQRRSRVEGGRGGSRVDASASGPGSTGQGSRVIDVLGSRDQASVQGLPVRVTVEGPGSRLEVLGCRVEGQGPSVQGQGSSV